MLYFFDWALVEFPGGQVRNSIGRKHPFAKSSGAIRVRSALEQ